jgi:hypothetical protein
MNKKTYHVNLFAWIVTTFMSIVTSMCFILIITLFVSSLHGTSLSDLLLSLAVGILFIPFSVYVALLFFDIPTMYLELSDEGVVFYGAGYRIYTPWDNVAALYSKRFSRSFPNVIQLREPAIVGEISFEEGKMHRQAVTEKRRWWMLVRQLRTDLRYTHFIRVPARFFRKKERQGDEIMQQFKLHRPELFIKPGEEK